MLIRLMQEALYLAADPSLHGVVGIIGGVIGIEPSISEVTADDGALGFGERFMDGVFE